MGASEGLAMNKLVIRRETANEPKWEGPAPIEGTPSESQRPKITAEEAERMSAENNRQITESYFNDHEWPLVRVLNWIAFRNPTRIADSSWHGLAYGHASRFEGRIRPKGPVEKDPRRVLLRALSKDKVTAARDGVALNHRIWGGVQVADLLNYSDTLFLRDEVLKEWKLARNPPAKASAAVQCRDWLVAERRDGCQRQTKEKYKAEAIKRFNVGPDQFRTAWDEAAQIAPSEGWGRAGRPKKSSGH